MRPARTRCLSFIVAAISVMAIALESAAPLALGAENLLLTQLGGGKKTASGPTGPVDVGQATWPQFLGAGRNNVSPEKGLLKKWPAKGPKQMTTIRGLGIGFSNIAIADGNVYTMGNRDERERVLAFSLATGERVWEYDNAAAYHNGFGDGPRSTPTIDGDKLYALGASGDLVCLERLSGQLVWKKNILREFGGSIPEWGISESVLIDGDFLLCTPGGADATMVKLNKTTGEVAWKSVTPQADRPAYTSIIAVQADGVRQYVNYTASAVIGIKADDGRFLWRDSSSANATANCCTAVCSDDMVFTSAGYGKGNSMLRLVSKGGEVHPELKYHKTDLQVHHGGILLDGGYVYGSSDPGILRCVELKTGKKKWENRSVGKASLTCVDGLLVVRSEQGPVALVQATPTGYKEHGRFTPPERSRSQAWTYPVVCGGKLFLRDQDILQVFDVAQK